MADEKLSLVIRNGKLSVHSRSSRGSALYLISITQDGTMKRCDGVNSRTTNFLCNDEERRVIVQ